MAVTVAPGDSFEVTSVGFATGLVGTIGIRILDGAGGTTTARVTAGIVEFPSGSGIYLKTLTAPLTAGQYTVMWDTGTVSPTTVQVEALTVTTSLAAIS